MVGETPRLTLERMDDSPNPMVRLMFQGRALCSFYTSLARLTALEAALDDSWAEAILEQRDQALEAVRTLSSIYDSTRVDLCRICEVGICSAHQPSEGIVPAVTREYVSLKERTGSIAEALRMLVWLKDGPHDLAYEIMKEGAWEMARTALKTANLWTSEKPSVVPDAS